MTNDIMQDRTTSNLGKVVNECPITVTSYPKIYNTDKCTFQMKDSTYFTFCNGNFSTSSEMFSK